VTLGFVDPLPVELLEMLESDERRIWHIPNHTEYGHMMGAYWVMRSPDGEILGVIAAEIDMSDINHTLGIYVRTVVLGAFIIMMLCIFGAIFYMRKRVTDPIGRLSQSAAGFVSQDSQGELQPIVSVYKTGDEIQTLSDSIEKMTTDMITYISNLTAVTAEKERIGAELSVATQIQASMLPRVFPNESDAGGFPKSASKIELFATMEPAKEVGGDFYDFFFIDDNTLGVVMADVSGKGVPAALFMVVAKTLIKTNALRGLSPRQVFEISNDMLCENNDAGMFVTAFMGYLDISSGKFTFVNAGHNPPLIKKAEGAFEWLRSSVGLVLAGMEGMTYREGEITLEAGDELFLYTDGVTEAHDCDNNLFSDPVLLETANNAKYSTLDEFTAFIKTRIDEFAGEAPQADDITMLMLRVKD
jgi:sigma-B regulation protein RsbU (phosphoserine phosphatase)